MNAPRQMRKSLRKSQKPKLPKIKSSPSHGALAAARANHAKLHRRGNSTSTQSPVSPTFLPNYLLQTTGPVVPASAHAGQYPPPGMKERKSSKVKIKPLLRKFSSQEHVSIDLSRSAAENEGLGIYTASEISGAPESGSGRRGGYHNRTASAASQLSSTTTSSNPRYGTQYVHPMRQTPRPYTPPIASSYKTSLESEATTVNTSGNTSIEAPYFDSQIHSTSHPGGTPYAPLPSSRRPHHLHIRTSSSIRMRSPSQTNLPGTPSSLRFNTDTISPSDNVAPAARSSLESAFRMRSRSSPAEVDPAAQKAIVDLKRQEFNEREAAKEFKYQQAEARAQEKEARRRERREEEDRRTSEKRERRRARSNAASEKSSFLTVGEAHEGVPSVQAPPPPQGDPVATAPQPTVGRKRGDTAGSAGKAGKAVRSQWTLFWFRFKTMWLRLKRKMSKSSS